MAARGFYRRRAGRPVARPQCLGPVRVTGRSRAGRGVAGAPSEASGPGPPRPGRERRPRRTGGALASEWTALVVLPKLRRHEPTQLHIAELEEVDEDLLRLHQVLPVLRQPSVPAPYVRPPPVVAAVHVAVSRDPAQLVLVERGPLRIVPVDQPLDV